MRKLRELSRRLFRRFGYAVINTRRNYADDGLFTYHGDHFRKQPAFRAAYERGVMASLGHDPRIEWRIHTALWAASAAMNVPGDFLECGVNAGFTSSAILNYLEWTDKGRRFYLVDTFEGPPTHQYSAEEVEHGRVAVAQTALQSGSYVTDVDRVRSNFAQWPYASVVKGAAPDVLATLDIQRLAFLHLDMNCAYPERATLEFFWDRLSPGGFVLLDDYTYVGHHLQTGAIDELVSRLGARVLSLPTGQGLIVK